MRTRVLPAVVAGIVFLSVGVFGYNDIPANILTNSGKLLSGSLNGIAPIIQLEVSPPAHSVGPRQGFNICLSAIHQISIDFPRIVIETDNRTYVGPFSAFSGITEVLTLYRGNTKTELPITSLQAIAVNGRSVHQVPAEWLGGERLSIPLTFVAADKEPSTQPSSKLLSAPTLSPLWNELYPQRKLGEENRLRLFLILAVSILYYFGL